MIRDQQIDRLSEFFMHIAEALIISSFTIQVLTKADLFTSIRTTLFALFCLLASLGVLGWKSRDI